MKLAPMPRLVYDVYDHYDPKPYPTGGSHPIATALDVTVSARRGDVHVYVSGPMLKKDGTPGRHHRSSMVDLEQDQPVWLWDIIRDARSRLICGAS